VTVETTIAAKEAARLPGIRVLEPLGERKPKSRLGPKGTATRRAGALWRAEKRPATVVPLSGRALTEVALSTLRKNKKMLFYPTREKEEGAIRGKS